MNLTVSTVSANPQFKGAFRINYTKLSPEIRRDLEGSLGHQGFQIFDNFAGKENIVFYVLRKSKDAIVAKFIQEHHIRGFQFLPDVSTKLRFDTQKPHELINYLRNVKPKRIKTQQQMLEYVEQKQYPEPEELKKSKPTGVARALVQKETDLSLVDDILKKLKLTIPGERTVNEDGIIVVKSEDGPGLLKISPINYAGKRYVYAKPNNSYEDDVRCTVDKSGEIRYYRTPDEILTFRRSYSQLIKSYRESKANTSNI